MNMKPTPEDINLIKEIKDLPVNLSLNGLTVFMMIFGKKNGEKCPLITLAVQQMMSILNMANFTEQEIRAIIIDELRNIFGANNQQDIKYLPTHEAYRVLGYKSPAQLREQIPNGTFRLGIEVQDRRAKNALKSNYYWNIPKCEQRLNTAPEKRA